MYYNLGIKIIIGLVLIGAGCGQDVDIEPATVIERIEIYSTPHNRNYAVSALIVLRFPNSCHGHHETHKNRSGNTVYVDITKSISGELCSDAEHHHYEVVFLGVFVPGEHTLWVNDIEWRFQV